MIHPPLPEEDLAAISLATSKLWKSSGSFSLFLTGATGFIGTWLLESLDYVSKAYGISVEVTALSRNPSAFLKRMPHLAESSWIQWIEGDLNDVVLPTRQIDYIIHAASETQQRNNDSVAMNTISGMYHSIEKVIQVAKNCGTKSILFTSSGAVYGHRTEENRSMSEEQSCLHTSTDLKSSYGIGKLLSEHMLTAFGNDYGCNIAIARCFAFVGPHLPLKQNFAIGNFVCDALAKRPITIQSDGKAVRSYLYAADLTIWLWTMLFKCQGVNVVNVGSPDSITICELAKLISQMYEISFIIASNAPSSVSSFYYPCTDLARDQFGLRPSTELREGIQKTFQWYQNTI